MAALGWRGQYLRYRDFFLNIWSVYRRRKDVMAFLEIIFSLSTISIFSLLALKPTLLTIAQLIKDNQTKEAAIAKMDEKIKNLGIAQGILSRDAANINLIESAVPTVASPETFVRQLEGLNGSQGVALIGISIGQVTILGPQTTKSSRAGSEKLPEGAMDLDFNVSVTGAYQNLFGFISGLEDIRRPVKIDVMNFNLSATELGKTLVLVISGRTPYLGQEEAASK